MFARDMLLIFGVGACSLVAPAMVLAALGYLEIVAGTAFGWFVFGDFPKPATWLGIAVIAGSGLYILNRERLRAAG